MKRISVLPAMLALVALWCLPASAGEKEEKRLSPGEKAILERLDDINKTLERINARLKKLEEEEEEEKSAGEAAVPGPPWHFPGDRRGADLEALRRVELPEDPTEEEVRRYLKKIARTSRGQNTWSSDDPQVRMLTEIGPEHLDLLLEYGSQAPLEFYLIPAAKRLVRPRHKELILNRLPLQPELVEVVLQKGWAEDARDILLRMLRNPAGGLPVEWVEAVARLEDPETYDELKDFMVRSDMPEKTYLAIRNLPGIELEQAVAEGWKGVSARRDTRVRKAMARVAARFGHRDALKGVIRQTAKRERPWNREKARKLVWRLTEQMGSSKELMEWFRTHEDELKFDPEKKQYFVPKQTE